MEASGKNDKSGLQSILDKRPDLVDVGIDKNDRTMLMKAILTGQQDMVAFLSGLGANMDRRLDKFYNSALMYASECPNKDILATMVNNYESADGLPINYDLGGSIQL